MSASRVLATLNWCNYCIQSKRFYNVADDVNKYFQDYRIVRSNGKLCYQSQKIIACLMWCINEKMYLLATDATFTYGGNIVVSDVYQHFKSCLYDVFERRSGDIQSYRDARIHAYKSMKHCVSGFNLFMNRIMNIIDRFTKQTRRYRIANLMPYVSLIVNIHEIFESFVISIRERFEAVDEEPTVETMCDYDMIPYRSRVHGNVSTRSAVRIFHDYFFNWSNDKKHDILNLSSEDFNYHPHEYICAMMLNIVNDYLFVHQFMPKIEHAFFTEEKFSLRTVNRLRERLLTIAHE